MLISGLAYIVSTPATKDIPSSPPPVFLKPPSFGVIDHSSHPIDLTQEEKDFLAANPTLSIGVDFQWPPFEFVEHGAEQGYSLDLLRLIEQRLGIHFDYVRAKQWSELFAAFKKGDLPALSMVAPNEERENFALFGLPILQSNLALALPKTATQVVSFSQLAGKKIGAIAEYWYLAPLRALHPEISIVEFASINEVLESLMKGHIDGYLDIQPVLHYYIDRYFSQELKLSLPLVLSNAPTFTYHIGVHKNYPLLRSILDKALRSIPPQTILDLQRKWLGHTLSSSLSRQLLFDTHIQQFLTSHKQVRLGIDTGWPPFEFTDATGKHQGVVKEILDYVLVESLGITPLPITAPVWKNHLDAIKNGEIDMIAGIVYSQERAKNMHFTKPYLTMPLMVLGKMYDKPINSLRDLEGKTVGIVNGYVTLDILKDKYPSITPLPFPDVKTGLIALSQGQVDYFFDGLAAMNYTIRVNGITNLKLLGDTGESYALSFGVRKDWPELAEALNYVIDTTPRHVFDEIVAPWIHVEIQSTIDYSMAWKTVVIFTFIIGFIVYWNRRLQAEINQRKKVEVALVEAQLQAQRANRAKSEFLSNMSHEIRTPMNAVIGFAELTAKMDLPPKALHNIQTIQKSAKSLVRLINDILDLSKIEAGKIEIRREATSLHALAEELYSIFSLRAQNKGLAFEVTLAPDIPKALILDELRVRQILVNLIGNAVKFTHEGSVHVRFSLSPHPNNNSTINIHVKVEDTGIGIHEQDQQKVFGMFEQQSTQDNRTYGGTGLGLAISQKFANLMGGNIHLQSTPGKGSTFTLELLHVEVAASLPKATQAHASAVVFEKASVLIVDDIKENLDLLGDILESYGLEVIKTHLGEKAIVLAEEERPELILMDIKMPKVDGITASKAIRANALTAHIPIIAVSASVVGEEEEAKRGAFEAFIPKPIDMQELETTLMRFLPHHTAPSFYTQNHTPSLAQNPFTSLAPQVRNVLLEKAREALESGDFEQIEALMEHITKATQNTTFTQPLQHALETIDIQTLETELGKIIALLQEGISHDF